MIMLYFSGTGNSRYAAERFAEKMQIPVYSIEEKMDFAFLLAQNNTIGFCFPTYCSRPPRIMRDFAAKHLGLLKDKKVILFCTQYLFSGDGAAAFTYYLPENHLQVIYAEHFFMPNNICNAEFFPAATKEKIQTCLLRTEKKLDRICADLRGAKTLKRGFNPASKLLGLIQGAFAPAFENKYRNCIKTDRDCNGCGLCVSLCPVKNLELRQNAVFQNNNCILCYRCVNICPQKAVTCFVHVKPEKQFRGIRG